MKNGVTLKNFTDDFSLVTDDKDTPFAYNHNKHGFLHADPDDDSEVDLHPISEEGIVDYQVTVIRKRKEITPRFVKMIPK
jgi:hypothetical protein